MAGAEDFDVVPRDVSFCDEDLDLDYQIGEQVYAYLCGWFYPGNVVEIDEYLCVVKFYGSSKKILGFKNQFIPLFMISKGSFVLAKNELLETFPCIAICAQVIDFADNNLLFLESLTSIWCLPWSMMIISIDQASVIWTRYYYQNSSRSPANHLIDPMLMQTNNNENHYRTLQMKKLAFPRAFLIVAILVFAAILAFLRALIVKLLVDFYHSYMALETYFM
uniref:Uncharacterized protein n=1 Tax=Panagrolaimus sp. JU765 TaxID=591449 RepID=A0AC34QDE2_9BILA